MKKYRVREKSLMWHLLRAKKPLQIIGMSIAFLLIFTAMSATAADDLQTYELQRGQAQSEEDVKPAEKVAVNGDMTPETAAEWTSLGEFKLTAYCPCTLPPFSHGEGGSPRFIICRGACGSPAPRRLMPERRK